MVVHPAAGHASGTLVNALKGRGQALAEGGGEERAGLVHRLDKETSGLLVIAKTERAHRVLSKAISERRVTRRYAALCWGHLDKDDVTVDRAIGRDPSDRRRMAVSASDHHARYLPFAHTGLSETPNLPLGDTLARLKPVLEDAAIATVLLSIFAHGLTARPGIALHARRSPPPAGV